MIERSTRDAATRLGLLIGVPVAVVIGLNAVAWAAASLKSWNSGDTLTAADLNANFTAINAAFVDLTGDQTIGGAKTFSGNVTVQGQLALGIAQYFATPNSLPGSQCVRASGFNVGVFECSCPSGTAVLNGGATACASNGGASDFLAESHQQGPSTWRVACKDTTAALKDCCGINLTCARLGP